MTFFAKPPGFFTGPVSHIIRRQWCISRRMPLAGKLRVYGLKCVGLLHHRIAISINVFTFIKMQAISSLSEIRRMDVVAPYGVKPAHFDTIGLPGLVCTLFV